MKNDAAKGYARSGRHEVELAYAQATTVNLSSLLGPLSESICNNDSRSDCAWTVP